MRTNKHIPSWSWLTNIMRSFTTTAMVVSSLLISSPSVAQTPVWKKIPPLWGQALLDTIPAQTLTEKMRFFLQAMWSADKSLRQMSKVVESSFADPKSVEISFVTMQEFDALVGNAANASKTLNRSGASYRMEKNERKDGKTTRDLFLIGIDIKNIESIPDLGGTLINEFTTFLDIFGPKMDGKSTVSVWWDMKTIASITLSTQDTNALAHSWLLEWVSSIAEAVTTARLHDQKEYQEKTYEELADELIMQIKSWKFRHDDPDGYAYDYLGHIIRQFYQKDFILSEKIQQQLAEEFLKIISENRPMIILYLQNLRSGVQPKK